MEAKARIDPDNPEWSDADFAVARGPEALPPALLAAFPDTKPRGGRPSGSDRQLVSIRSFTSTSSC